VDAVGFELLLREMGADLVVMGDALRKAQSNLGEKHETTMSCQQQACHPMRGTYSFWESLFFRVFRVFRGHQPPLSG